MNCSTQQYSSQALYPPQGDPFTSFDLYERMHPAKSSAPVSPVTPAAQVNPDPDILGSGYRAEVAAALMKLGYTSAADKYLLCGKKAVAVLTCPTSINHSARPIFEHCDNRICSRCASRLSARLVEHYAPAIENIVAKNQRRGYRLRHVILTTDIHPLDQNAKARYEHVRREVEPTFRDLICPRQADETARDWRDRWRAKKQTTGAIIVDEFGEEGQKLHFHVTYYGPFIPQALLSQVWASHTGYRVVYITSRQDQPIRDIVQETLKYVTKFAVDGQATGANVLAAIYDILAGRRRVRSWGLFYNIPPAPEEEEEHGECPECQAQLEILQVGKFLERTNTYIKALQADETTPDLSLEVVTILAHAAVCSHTDVMFSARRQWGEVWNGSESIPDPAEYASSKRETEATPP